MAELLPSEAAASLGADKESLVIAPTDDPYTADPSAPGTVFVKIPERRIRKQDPSTVAGLVEDAISVAAALPGTAPAPPLDTRLSLVNLVPTYVTSSDLEDIRSAGRHAAAAYEAIPTEYPRGLAYGLAGLVAGAVVWGLVGAYLEFQSWLLAIGAGYLIAMLTVRGAGKITGGVRAMIGALTVGTALRGLILIIAFSIYRFAGVFEPVEAARIFFRDFEAFRGDALFGIGGGLLGAFFAARSARRPDFNPEIG